MDSMNIQMNSSSTKNTNKMKLNWFRRDGIFYRPITIIGWLVFIILISVAVYAFVAINIESHSVSDTLINFAPIFLFILIAYFLIGNLTSRNDEYEPEFKIRK